MTCFSLLRHWMRAFINDMQKATACEIGYLFSFSILFSSNQSDWYSQMVQR